MLVCVCVNAASRAGVQLWILAQSLRFLVWLYFLGLTNAFGKIQANNTIKAFCITFYGYKKIVIFFGKQNYVGHGSFYQRRVI